MEPCLATFRPFHIIIAVFVIAAALVVALVVYAIVSVIRFVCAKFDESRKREEKKLRDDERRARRSREAVAARDRELAKEEEERLKTKRAAMDKNKAREDLARWKNHEYDTLYIAKFFPRHTFPYLRVFPQSPDGRPIQHGHELRSMCVGVYRSCQYMIDRHYTPDMFNADLKSLLGPSVRLPTSEYALYPLALTHSDEEIELYGMYIDSYWESGFSEDWAKHDLSHPDARPPFYPNSLINRDYKHLFDDDPCPTMQLCCVSVEQLAPLRVLLFTKLIQAVYYHFEIEECYRLHQEAVSLMYRDSDILAIREQVLSRWPRAQDDVDEFKAAVRSVLPKDRPLVVDCPDCNLSYPAGLAECPSCAIKTRLVIEQ